MVIDFFFYKFSVTWQKVLLVIGGILVNLALLYITMHSVNVVWILKNQELASLPLSNSWSFAPIPIGCVLMIYYITVNIIRNLRKAGESS
jgi:TRAP-type C4-dicarboxylate transport system permease small subunit